MDLFPRRKGIVSLSTLDERGVQRQFHGRGLSWRMTWVVETRYSSRRKKKKRKLDCNE